MKNFETLQVGRTYLNRRGERVKIVEKDENLDDPFIDEIQANYFHDGRYGRRKESPNDLIEILPEEGANAKQIIDKHLPCTCDKAYKDRNLDDPDCFRCQHEDTIIAMMEEYNTAVPAERIIGRE